MKARFSGTALSEIEHSLDWLGARNPAAAQTLSRAISGTIARLEKFLHSGMATSDQKIRTTVVLKFGYRLFYEIDGQELRILHVRHGARDWPDDKGA